MNKIKNEIFRITGIMLLFLVLLVSGAQSQTNINSCTKISVPGEYVLTQDLIGQPPGYQCISITSRDVIFNGAGHIIDGVVTTPGTAGIEIDSGNITIENTTIIHWDFDITTGSGNAIKIIGNNLGNADTMCIFLNHATSASVKSNNISDSYYGIGLDTAANDLLKDNIISRNVYGIWIGKMISQNSVVSSNDLLEGNIVTRNDYGVYIDTLGSNILSNNIILNNGIGVYSNFSISNALYSNNMSNNNISINLDNSSFNIVKNNNVSISGVGIFLHSSVKNSIYDNYFYNNYNAIDNNGGNIWNVSKTLGTNIIGGPYIGGNFWADYTGNDTSGDRLGDTLIPYNSAGYIKSGGDFLPLTMSLGVVKIVVSGETVTSDTGGIGTSSSNPVVVNVTSPNAGTVTINISHTTQTAPSGFSFLNQQIDITAPPTTAPSLLKIVFTISSTQIPLGQDQNTIQIFKNGIVVNKCPGSGAIPDPCISNRSTLTNGDIQITIFSSSGDPWNIGIPVTPAGPSKGSISGTKFEDLNANGIKDAGEVGLQGWQININGTDTITNTVINETITTDINGDYNFTGLNNGTYVVTETGRNGWVQSAPETGKYTVIMTNGAMITNQNFGNFHMGKITGGGWISIRGDPKATFGIVGQYPGGKTAQGNVEYQDHKVNLNIKSIQISTVATTLDNKKGSIAGLAQVNGAGSYPFVVYVENNGGKGKDVFKISLPTYPYSNGATLAGGNIQIHG